VGIGGGGGQRGPGQPSGHGEIHRRTGQPEWYRNEQELAGRLVALAGHRGIARPDGPCHRRVGLREAAGADTFERVVRDDVRAKSHIADALPVRGARFVGPHFDHKGVHARLEVVRRRIKTGKQDGEAAQHAEGAQGGHAYPKQVQDNQPGEQRDVAGASLVQENDRHREIYGGAQRGQARAHGR